MSTRRHRAKKQETLSAGIAVRPLVRTCRTCGCSIHQQPRTWQVVCTLCGENRWPYTVVEPEGYVCDRCYATPPEKRARLLAGAKKGQETLRKRDAGGIKP